MVVSIIVLIIFCCLAIVFYSKRERKREQEAQKQLNLVQARNLKPISRHPQIDLLLCIGCSSCVAICPETHGTDSPLAIVNGQCALVNPIKCIGHGKCEMVCPVGAITVGLGQLANDPTIPKIDTNYESIIKGIFIIGELSGVALIKNALEQGLSVIKTISNQLQNTNFKKQHKNNLAEATEDNNTFSIIIVGSGPSGLAASLKAEELKIKYITLEQNEFGGTVAHYPKQKLILTSPIQLPLYGKFRKKTILKEELLSIWFTIKNNFHLQIKEKEKVTSIIQTSNIFHVKTNANVYKAPFVVLALGRRANTRKLGIEGENLLKVIYSLIDAAAYKNKNIVVVGGGDSAIEAALVLSENNNVSLSYRQDSFMRLKKKNKQKIELAEKKGKLTIYFQSKVIKIEKNYVFLQQGERSISLENDFIFILIGGGIPTDLLLSTGVITKQ